MTELQEISGWEKDKKLVMSGKLKVSDMPKERRDNINSEWLIDQLLLEITALKGARV